MHCGAVSQNQLTDGRHCNATAVQDGDCWSAPTAQLLGGHNVCSPRRQAPKQTGLWAVSFMCLQALVLLCMQLQSLQHLQNLLPLTTTWTAAPSRWHRVLWRVMSSWLHGCGSGQSGRWACQTRGTWPLPHTTQPGQNSQVQQDRQLPAECALRGQFKDNSSAEVCLTCTEHSYHHQAGRLHALKSHLLAASAKYAHSSLLLF